MCNTSLFVLTVLFDCAFQNTARMASVKPDVANKVARDFILNEGTDGTPTILEAFKVSSEMGSYMFSDLFHFTCISNILVYMPGIRIYKCSYQGRKYQHF